MVFGYVILFFFFKQKTAYEMRISDWSSDVCSSDLLDVLLVRKIGAPGHEELGIGAVVDGSHPQLVLNEDVLRTLRIPQGYIERQQQLQLAEIERRRHIYRGERTPATVDGRTIIVDRKSVV